MFIVLFYDLNLEQFLLCHCRAKRKKEEKRKEKKAFTFWEPVALRQLARTEIALSQVAGQGEQPPTCDEKNGSQDFGARQPGIEQS